MIQAPEYIDIDDVVAELLPEMQNVPEATIRQAFMLALQEFCRRSKWWRFSFPCTVIGEEGFAKVNIPENTTLEKVYSVVAHNYPYNIAEESFVIPPDMVAIRDLGHTCVGVAYGAIAPDDDADQVDKRLWSRWRDTLRSGTIYYLRSQYGREWFQAEIAVAHRGNFDDGIAKAVHEVQETYYRKSPARARSRWI